MTETAGQLQDQNNDEECSVDQSWSDVGQQQGQIMNNDESLNVNVNEDEDEDGNRGANTDMSCDGEYITDTWYNQERQNKQYYGGHTDSHRSHCSSSSKSNESNNSDRGGNNTNTSNEYSDKDKDYYIFSSPINPRYGSTFKTPGTNYTGTGTIFRGSEAPITVSHSASKKITSSFPDTPMVHSKGNLHNSTAPSKIHRILSEGNMTAKDAYEQNLLWLYSFRREVQKCFPMRKDAEMLIKDSLKVVRALFSTGSGHKGISRNSGAKASHSSSMETHDFHSSTAFPNTISPFVSRPSHSPASTSFDTYNNLCPSLTRTRRLVSSDEDSSTGGPHYTSTLEERLYLMAERKYGLRVMAVQYVASFLATAERCAVVNTETGKGSERGVEVTVPSSGKNGDMKHRGAALVRRSRHPETESAKVTCGDTLEIDQVELITFLAIFRNEVGDDYHLQQTHLVLSINRLLSKMCRAGVVSQPSCRVSSPVSVLTFPESLREYSSDNRAGKQFEDESRCLADGTLTFSSISLSVGMWMEGVVKILFDKEVCSIIEPELHLISLKVCMYIRTY